MSGSFGLVLRGCTIDSVVVGSPAHQLKCFTSGDCIVAIDGVAVDNSNISTVMEQGQTGILGTLSVRKKDGSIFDVQFERHREKSVILGIKAVSPPPMSSSVVTSYMLDDVANSSINNNNNNNSEMLQKRLNAMKDRLLQSQQGRMTLEAELPIPTTKAVPVVEESHQLHQTRIDDVIDLRVELEKSNQRCKELDQQNQYLQRHAMEAERLKKEMEIVQQTLQTSSRETNKTSLLQDEVIELRKLLNEATQQLEKARIYSTEGESTKSQLAALSMEQEQLRVETHQAMVAQEELKALKTKLSVILEERMNISMHFDNFLDASAELARIEPIFEQILDENKGLRSSVENLVGTKTMVTQISSLVNSNNTVTDVREFHRLIHELQQTMTVQQRYFNSLSSSSSSSLAEDAINQMKTVIKQKSTMAQDQNQNLQSFMMLAEVVSSNSKDISPLKKAYKLQQDSAIRNLHQLEEDNRTLTNRISSLQHQINSIQKEFSKSEASNEEMFAEIVKLNRVIDGLQAASQHDNNTTMLLTSQLSLFEEVRQDLYNLSLSASKDQNSNMEVVTKAIQVSEAVQQENSRLREENTELRSVKAKLEEMQLDLHQQLQVSQSQLVAVELLLPTTPTSTTTITTNSINNAAFSPLVARVENFIKDYQKLKSELQHRDAADNIRDTIANDLVNHIEVLSKVASPEKIRDLADSLSVAEGEATELKKRLQMVLTEDGKLKEENEQIRERLREMDRVVEALRSRNQWLEKLPPIDSIRVDDASASAIDRLVRQIEVLTHQRDDNAVQLDTWKEKHNSLQLKYDKLESESREVYRQMQELSEEKKGFDQRVLKLEQKHSDEIRILEGEKRSLSVQREQMQELMEYASKDLENVRKEKKELENTVLSLRQQLQKARLEEEESNVTSQHELVKQMDKLRRDKQNLEVKLESQEQQDESIRLLNQQLDRLRAEKAQLGSRIAELEESLEVSTSKLDKLNKEKRLLEIQKDGVESSAAVELLKQQLELSKSDVERLEQRWKQHHEEEKGEKHKLIEQLEVLRKENAALELKIIQGDNDVARKLRSEKKTLEEQVKRYEEEEEAQRSKIELLKLDKKQLESKLQQKIREDEASPTKSQLMTQLETFRSQLKGSSLDSSVETSKLRKEIARLEEEITGQSQQLEKSKREKLNLDAKISEFEEIGRTQTQLIDKLKRDRSRLEGRVQELEDEQKSFAEKNKKTEQEKGQLSIRANQLEADLIEERKMRQQEEIQNRKLLALASSPASSSSSVIPIVQQHDSTTALLLMQRDRNELRLAHEELDKLRLEKRDLQSRMHSMEERESELRGQMERVRKEKVSAEEKSKEHEEEIQRVWSEQLKKVRREKMQLESDKDEEISRLTDKLDRVNRERVNNDVTIQNLVQEVGAAKRESENAKRQIRQLEEDLHSSGSTGRGVAKVDASGLLVEQMAQQLRRKEEDFEQQERKLKQNTERLQRELDDYKNEQNLTMQKMRREKNELENKASQLEHELSAIENRRKKEKTEADEKMVEAESLRLKNRDLEQSLSRMRETLLQHENSSMLLSPSVSFEKQKYQLQLSLDQCASEKEALQQKVEQLGRVKVGLEEKIKGLEEKIKGLEDRALADMAKWRNELANREAAISEQNEKLSRCETAVVKLRRENTELTDEKEKQEHVIKSGEAQIKQLKDETIQLKGENSTLEVTVRQLRTSFSGEQVQLSAENELKTKKLIKERDGLQLELDVAHKRISELSTLNTELKNQVQKANEELIRSQTQIKEKITAQLQEMAMEDTALQNSILEQQNAITILSSSLNEREQQLREEMGLRQQLEIQCKVLLEDQKRMEMSMSERERILFIEKQQLQTELEQRQQFDSIISERDQKSLSARRINEELTSENEQLQTQIHKLTVEAQTLRRQLIDTESSSNSKLDEANANSGKLLVKLTRMEAKLSSVEEELRKERLARQLLENQHLPKSWEKLRSNINED